MLGGLRHQVGLRLLMVLTHEGCKWVPFWEFQVRNVQLVRVKFGPGGQSQETQSSTALGAHFCS